MSRTLMFALGSLVVAAIFLAFANFGGEDGQGGGREYAFTLVVDVVVAAILFWLAQRFLARPDTPALVLAALAAVALAVFWLGLTPVFAGAAAYLVLGPPAAGAADEPARRSGQRTAALGLASLATLAFAVLCFVG